MSSTTASMSCPSCQGLGRSHRSATLVCSQTASCPGCLPCHSCPSLVTSGSVPGNNHGPATGSRTGSPTRRPPLPPVLAIKDGIPGKTAMTSPSKTSTPEAREFTAEQSPKISSPEVARQSSSSSLINSVTALDSATASTSKLANDMPNSPPRRSGSMHIPRQARAEKVIHLSKKMGESQISGGDSGTKDSSVTSSGSMGGLRKSASAHYKSLYMLSQRAAQKRGEKTSGSLTSVSPTATTTTMSKSESQEHPFSERSRRETCDTVQSAITDSSIFSDPDAAKSSRLSLVASVATVKISKPLERYAGQKESVLRSSMTLSSSIPSVTGSLSPSSPGAPQESETEERQSPGMTTLYESREF